MPGAAGVICQLHIPARCVQAVLRWSNWAISALGGRRSTRSLSRITHNRMSKPFAAPDQAASLLRLAGFFVTEERAAHHGSDERDQRPTKRADYHPDEDLDNALDEQKVPAVSVHR